MTLAMGDLAAKTGAPEARQSEAFGSVSSVVRRAEELLDDRDVLEARRLIEEALDAGGSRAILLWALADVDFADTDLVAARARLAEAVDEGGREPAAIARQVRVLRRNGLWRDALLAVEAIPADERRDPLIRAETGDFYRGCGCHAYASDCYGARDGLRRSTKATRRWCWLRSGGPLTRLRSRVRQWEETKLLPRLRQGLGNARLLDEIGLGEQQAQRSRIQLETLEYRRLRLSYGWDAVTRAGYRLMPAVIVPMWLVLLVIIHQTGFASGLGSAAAGAALSAFIATSFVILLVIVLVKPDLRPRFQLRVSARLVIAYFLAVGVFEAAVGDGYDRRVLPVVGWWSWVTLGLVAIPAAVACLPAASMISYGLWRWRIRILIREDCLLVVLHVLLSTLEYLRSATCNRSIKNRLTRARQLEFAARCLTRDLLPSRTVSYLGSGDWLTRRVAGWAQALIQMQRQIVNSNPRGQTKLESLLAHEIRCLATGNLGALVWNQPPPPLPRRVVFRRQAITLARTILVAGLPLAVVLISRQFVHASPGVFGWFRVTTGAWALLYILLSLDPTIREKIDTAHEIAGLLHAPPSGSGDSQRSSQAAR
jgi:hypothetical protein